MGIFVGGTGSGKTYSAISTACELDRATLKDDSPSRFNIDRIVFSASEFMELVKQDLPRGSVIIWDETGIGINSRLFYEQNNLAISYTTQTFRFKNYIIFYTTPSFSYIDKQVRQLFHARVQMFGVSQKMHCAYGRWSWMDYNSDTGKIFYKTPRVPCNGVKSKVGTCYFPMPPLSLVEQYETKRKEVMEKLYEKYKGMVVDGEKESSKRTPKDLATVYHDVYANIADFLGTDGKVLIGKIRIKHSIGKDNAYAVVRMIQQDLDSGKLIVKSIK